ncbi:AsmA family protein [Phaeobacter sp. J2-8]|uniref:AsmA family protein n=1 Tax=Phaeobacter sp. J2-8 TaxID=2931394 RepID=UPI001FD0473D|nr:AsmA family protein [Phaeobacter sp. J2-8]MCJ7871581.1 AsmA family protein [Phaeobacter sp. J2-8]
MKWLLRLIGLVVLIAGVAVASLLLLPRDRLARIASDQMSTQLGRDVSISGDVSLTLYPILGISTGAISIANADWAGDTPMFQADAATIALETLPLLQRNVRIKGLHAESPQVLLQRDGSGRANWMFSEGDSTDSGGGSTLASLSIEDLTLTNGAIRFEDAGSAPLDLRGVDFALKWPDPTGPADLDLVLRPAGQAVSVVAELASPLNFMAGGAHPVTAKITTEGGTANFTGKASLVPEVQGKLSADLSSTAQFLASLGLGATELPEGLGRAINASTDLTFNREQRLALRGLQAKLDQNTLTGDIDVFLAGKPRVNGQLSAGDLDLSSLTASGSGGNDADTTGWSKTPIDASALSLFDGEVLIDANSLDLGTVSFGRARILATNDNARAVFSIRELVGYDGTFNGQFVINNRNGLSVGGDLRGSNVEAKSLMRDLTGVDRLSGKANAELEFLAVGQSMDAIVASLRGKGAMKFGRGVISGIDLDKLMRSGDGSGGTTIFDSLAATWDISSGKLQNDDLAMILSLLNADGDGWVNLYEQTIDYTFTPRLLKAREGKGLAIPVRIQGPWSAPKISADIAKAIDMNFADEKKLVEDEVKKRISEEIGLDLQETESVEDAVKKKVEDEILKGLGGFLGNN